MSDIKDLAQKYIDANAEVERLTKELKLAQAQLKNTAIELGKTINKTDNFGTAIVINDKAIIVPDNLPEYDNHEIYNAFKVVNVTQ